MDYELFIRCVHEVFEAQRGAVEARYVVRDHEDIDIVVDRAKHPFVEYDILRLMHHAHALRLVA